MYLPLNLIISDFQLLDAYRFLFPYNIKTTWFSSTVSCRLDRFYISKLLVNDILTCDNLPFGYSDHDAVMLQIKSNTGITFGPGYWKFNNSLLQDKTFVQLFTKYWVELINGFDIDLDLWDHFSKNKLRILL